MGLSNEAKDSLLQAMDIIASNATSKLPYDTTVKAMVVNADNANDGYYTVQYENTKFTAYSENTGYKVNEYVRISIPNNDFSEQKYILGKWAEDASKPITYTSVSNTVLEVFSLINKQNITDIGIVANGDESYLTLGNIPPLNQVFEQLKQNNLFNTIFIEVGFQTYLGNHRMASGAYGVRLKIFDKDNQIITTLTLDSSEFFGNPYSYVIPIIQSKKLNITDLEQIKSVTVELYQDNNFTFYSDDNQDTILLDAADTNNIFIKSLHIGFGSDLSQIEDNTPKLFCKNNLTYSNNENTRKKEIGLLWFNKTQDNTYVGFNDGIAVFDPSKKDQNGTLVEDDASNLDIINYSNYDENYYLIQTERENSLKTQIADTSPLDELSLVLKSNALTKGIPAVTKAYQTLSQDFPSVLQDLSARMSGNEELTGDSESKKGKFTVLKNQIASIEGSFNEIMEREQPVYSIQEYEQGTILNKSEYDAIEYIEIKESENNVNWETLTSEKLKTYFSTTDYLEYVIKKDIRVKTKKILKVFPVQQQLLDVLTYGRECQNKGRDLTGNIVNPLFEVINSIYKVHYRFIQKQEILDLLDLAIDTYIKTCIDEVNALTQGTLRSYEGIWANQKEKLEKLQKILMEQKNIISNNLPIFTLTSNKITVEFLDNGVSKKIDYTLNNTENAVWKKDDWKSDFDHSNYDNLYSIYWFQYSPNWEAPENEKISFPDWKNISPTVDDYITAYNESFEKYYDSSLEGSLSTIKLNAHNESLKGHAQRDYNKFAEYNNFIETLTNKINSINKRSKQLISALGLRQDKIVEYDPNAGVSIFKEGQSWTEEKFPIGKYEYDSTKGTVSYTEYGELILFKINTIVYNIENEEKLPVHINFGLPTIEDTGKSTLYWNKSTLEENLQILNKTLNKDMSKERFKVVIVYNHTKYESKELVFTNDSLEKDLTLAAQDNHGFYIKHETNSKDNYQDNYSFTGVLNSKGDKDLERVVVAGFKDPTDQNTEVFNNSWIYWYVPKSATMLTFDDKKLLGATESGGYGFYTDKYKTVSCKNATGEYIYKMVPTSLKKAEKEKIILYSEKEIDENNKYYLYDSAQSCYLQDTSIKWRGDYLDTLYTSYNDYKKAGKNTEANELVKIIARSCDYTYADLNMTNGVKIFTTAQENKIKEECEKKLFFPKEENATYSYYELVDKGINFVISEKITREENDLKNTYPNLMLSIDNKTWVTFESLSKGSDKLDQYFIKTTETKNGKNKYYYQTVRKLYACCDGAQKKTSNTYNGDTFYFLKDNPIKKLIQTEVNGHKELQTVELYLEKDGYYILKDDLELNSKAVKIGIVGKNAEIYQYKIARRDPQSNDILSKTLKVVKEEFYDALTKNTYYKIYDEDIFLLKNEFKVIDPPYSKKDYYCYYKKIKNITGEVVESNKKFYYKIKNTFNQDATNNTIMCGIDGEAWTVDQTLATKTFSFGSFGSNGTEYSILVTPSRTVVAGSGTAADIVKTTLNISLHNGTGEEQDFPFPRLTWVGPTCCMEEATIRDDYDGKGYIATITSNITSKSDLNKYYAVLKIEIDLENVLLESYYPVPYVSSISGKKYELDGTTSIIYNSYGGFDTNYCIDPFSIYEISNSEKRLINNAQWSMQYVEGGHGEVPTSTTDQRRLKYMPTLNGNSLQPIGLFINNAECYASVVCKDNSGNILWIQPILIIQNRFLSNTLNKWDNKFNINEEQGTILSSMLGAGKKNSDNSFNGILMGDVRDKGGFGSIEEVKTGLYGFHEGAMSFGFTIDGEAFLGKSGKGRISFNGNHGTISSALWDGALDDFGVMTLGTRGMLIDLENGHIDAHDFRLTSQNIGLDSDPLVNGMIVGETGYYIRIGYDGNATDENGISLKTPGFFALDANGDLTIRVNKLYLTGQLGGINLIHQTEPKKNVPVIKSIVNGYIVYEKQGEEIKHTYDVANRDTNSPYPKSKWKISDASVELTGKQLSSTFIGPNNDQLGTCLSVKPANKSISQNIDNIDTTSTYAVSGYIRRSADKTGDATLTIETSCGNTPTHAITNNVFKFTKDDWTYFEYVFEVSVEDGEKKNCEISFKTDAQYYLYHAKVEKGSIATSWTPSKEDTEDNAESVKDKYDRYLAQDAIFEKLAIDPDNGDLMTGIWMVDGDESASGKNELYISATYIASGILRSTNFDGKFEVAKYGETYEESNVVATKPSVTNHPCNKDLLQPLYQYKLLTSPTQGLYFNLDEGKIWAAKFELNAWHHLDGDYGLYLNSHPSDADAAYPYYLQIGKDNSYITFDKNGSLKMKVNYFELTSALGSTNLLSDTGPRGNVLSVAKNADKTYSKNSNPISPTIYEEILASRPNQETKEAFKDSVTYIEGDYEYKFKKSITISPTPIRNVENKNSEGKIVADPCSYWRYDNNKILLYIGDNSGGGSIQRGKCLCVYNKVQQNSREFKQHLNVGLSSSIYILSGWINIGNNQGRKGIQFTLRPIAGSSAEKCIVHTFTPPNDGWNYFQYIFDIGAEQKKYNEECQKKKQQAAAAGKTQEEIDKIVSEFTSYTNPCLEILDKNVTKFNSNGTINDKNVTWFNQLKFEEGSVATQWEESYQDKQDRLGIYDSEILLQDLVFNRLTDNGKVKGVFLVDGQLYINATYIAAGVLRSTNFQGTFDKVTVKGKSYETVKTCTAGMFIDLNGGKIRAANFDLIVGTSGSAGYIRINSDTSTNSSGAYKYKPLTIGTKFSVDWNGKISASAGKIGNWNIDTNWIDSYTGTRSAYETRFFLDSDSGSTDYYLYAGGPKSSTDSTYTRKFSVSKKGKLYAQGADITGKITATSGEISATLITGQLHADHIQTNTITIGAGQVTSGTFDPVRIPKLNVDKLNAGDLKGFTIRTGDTQDNVTLNSSGALFRWGDGEGSLYGTITTTATKPTNYHTAREKYWTLLGKYGNINAISFGYDKNGTPAYFLFSGEDYNFDFVPGSLLGKFDYTGHTAHVFTGGSVTIQKGDLYLAEGGLAVDGMIYISGGGYSNGAFWATNTMSVGENPVTSDSDIRIKKDINLLSETKYEIFFNTLKPVSYQFINGTSDRTHLGFISQEVEEGLIKSGLDSYDFAGFVVEESDEKNLDGYKYQLRYSEFIALNTHMIQKCLKRIEELENEISILKNK